MSCRSFEKQLYLFREGELGPRQRRRLERHLKRCPACAAEAEAIARSATRIAELSAADAAAPVPADLRPGILSRLGETQAPPLPTLSTRRRGRIALVPTLAAAALVLLVLMTAHEVLLGHRLTRLESAMTAWTEAVTTQTREYARLTATLERIEPALRTAGFFTAGSTARPAVSRDDLLGWLSGRGLAGDLTPSLLNRLKAELPVLTAITLEDGLDSDEIRLLLEQRQRIATALRGL